MRDAIEIPELNSDINLDDEHQKTARESQRNCSPANGNTDRILLHKDTKTVDAGQGDSQRSQKSESEKGPTQKTTTLQAQYNSVPEVFSSMISTLPPRAERNVIYKVCYKVCTHFSFTLIITFLIITNTVVLALNKYPRDEELE